MCMMKCSARALVHSNGGIEISPVSKGQKPENLKWPVGTTTGIAQATPGTSSGPQTANSLLNNQNTCTDNSVCYSDNRSGNDDSGQIHDLINGDEIFCFNKACISQGGDSTHANCGGLAV